MQSFYFTNSRGEILTTDRDEILNLMKCEKRYPASELPANFNVIVNGIQAKFEEEIKKRVYEIESKESDPAMKFILRDIGILRHGASESLKRRIEKLNEFVRGKILINETAKKELRKLNRSKDTSLKEEYVGDLEKILYESGNTKRINEEKLTKRQQEICTQIIASEGLV